LLNLSGLLILTPILSLVLMKKTILLLLLFLTSLCSAQQLKDRWRDAHWKFGHGSISTEDSSDFGITNLFIDSIGLRMKYQAKIPVSAYIGSASMCDSAGRMIFYSSGYKVANSQNQVMLNGDTIGFGRYWSGKLGQGIPFPNTVFTLPQPGNDYRYYIFCSNVDVNLSTGVRWIKNVLVSVVDMRLDGGKGAVTTVDSILINQKTDYGKLTACRHANGRDWWMLIPAFDSNVYFRFLIDPTGIHQLPPQQIGKAEWSAIGQACFSPDGTRYARFNVFGNQYGNDLSLFDFDRCTGTLSNLKRWNIVDGSYCGGLAFSANSRFLYIPSYRLMYQLDLQDADPWAGHQVIGYYDGFYDDTPNLKAFFYQAQLAPNGKIYINTPNSTRYLHVVEFPDKKGEDCVFRQHSLRLLSWNVALPNFPYYRLGPVDGSACDTLGYDDILPPLTVSTEEAIVGPVGRISIWPNPAHDEITISLPTELTTHCHLELIGASGAVLLRREGLYGDAVVDLSALPKGLYFYRVYDGEGFVQTGKIILH
jgi:hypothetical protein